MNKIEKLLISILTNVCGVCLLMIISFIAMQVVTRYLLVLPTLWTLEASQYAFVALLFFGSIVTMAKDEDIKLTTISKQFHGVRLTSLKIFVLLIIFLINILFCLGSIKMAKLNWSLPSLTIPFFNLGYIYTITIFSSSLIAFIVFVCIINEFHCLIHNRESNLWK